MGSAVISGLNHNGLPRDGAVIAGISQSNRVKPVSGATTRLAPFADRQQLMAALDGVNRVFLMVPFGGEMRHWTESFIDCARKSQVQFIVRLSGLAAAPDSTSAMGRLQGELDALLASSGIDYCILRCNSFMQNYTGMYRQMLRRGRLALAHGNAGINFVDTRDIGAAAANILCAPEAYYGATLDFDGPEALSNTDVTDMISRITGRDIRYLPISEERAREGYRRLGLPGWEIEVFTSLDRFLREGHAARDSGDLKRVLGRNPGRFSDFALDHRALWAK